jgi:diguanylate cyclase (GGDEF)-like protein
MASPSRLAALFRSWISAETGIRRMMFAAFVALLAFSAALVGGLLHATHTADEATQANARTLLSNHLQVSIRALANAERVQLTWDDAIRAAGGQGPPLNVKWADMFFGQFLTSMVHADQLFLVAPDGRLLRGWQGGKPTDEKHYAPVIAGVRRTLAEIATNRSVNGRIARFMRLEDGAQWPLDDQGYPLNRWSGALVNFNGKPAVMTVIAITPDATASLLRRTPNHMVMLRYLDARMLADISGAVLLRDMRFDTVQPADPRRNSLILRDQGGRRLGWLSWQPNAVGSIVRERTVPLLAVYLVFYILVLAGGALLIRHALRLARELAASEAQAQHHALHDPMLGLPNRTHVMQRLTAMLTDVCESQGNDDVLLAYFDLDHFKAINETVGHHVGDDLLVQVVARVRQRMLPGDVLGRLASDEFVLLRRAPGGRDAADTLGNEIMAAFAEPFRVFGHSLTVTASCGVSWAPEQGSDAKVILRNADIALFRAKQRGRALYRRFTADMDATIRWRQDMEIELRRAIALDGLHMVYQPIVNVGDGSIASFEALLRWQHRDRGEIGPGIFVPVAEQCGLMPQLGDWVLRRVFADSHDFGAAEISVNLSPLQLVARDFLPTLKGLIAEERIDPTRFAFEITEGVVLDRTERVMGVIGELKDLGFRIALDDFGTGYSSLAYLRAFPFDRIKIDRSFVQGIESDIDAQSILRAIVSLGRTLRMKVVAEGVETLLQQQLVQAAGCQLIQGHLYWRALTPEQVVALLAADRVQNLRMAV